MSGPRVAELLNHLAHRGDVLKSLEEGHSDSREMQNKADKSRSSVDRDIRLFKDDGYVKEYVGDYQLTQFGRFALRYTNWLNAWPMLNLLVSISRLRLRLLF